MSDNKEDFSITNEEEILNNNSKNSNYSNNSNNILNNTLENINNVVNNTVNYVNGPTAKIISFFWSIIGLFAIFLSFKCNNGFNFRSLMGAIFFGPFYVAYKLGTKWEVCMAGIMI